ncbi:MAG: hypothetical protein L7U72_08655 [Rubripirellula sp.]|nr:hypothetical protein [Rubripirellula sp.]
MRIGSNAIKRRPRETPLARATGKHTPATAATHNTPPAQSIVRAGHRSRELKQQQCHPVSPTHITIYRQCIKHTTHKNKEANQQVNQEDKTTTTQRQHLTKPDTTPRNTSNTTDKN